MHSIRFRLSVLFVIVTTAALALFGMYGHSQLSRELNANFAQLQKSTVSRLTISMSVPMWDLNTDAGKTILEAEMLPQEVRAIRIFDASNKLFMGIARDKEGRIVNDGQVNVAGSTQGEALLYRQPGVTAGGVPQTGPAIGRVVVHFSRHHIEEVLRTSVLRNVLQVVVVDILLVLVLTLSLRMIFTPLGRLRDALFVLAHDDNEDVKELPETQRDEFGEVVKGFNETQRKLKLVIERHRKADEATRAESIKTEQAYQEAQKAMALAKSKTEALRESEVLLRARTEDLQNQAEALHESKLLLQARTEDLQNQAKALRESKVLLQNRTEDLQNQIREQAKTRKAMLNILEDIEVSRKETEATAHKMDAMSQAVDDALVMIDGSGKVLFWNQSAEKLFGYNASEAMGMDFHAMAVPPDVREKALAGLKTFQATGQGILFGGARETTAINRADETFPVEVNLSPFQLDEKWFAVGTVRDITERKQAEKELKERMDELERFSRLTINREEKMIQLKEEINALLGQAGQEKKYKIVE